MLLPALGKAREKAQAVGCLNNQKQIYHYHYQYSDENDGMGVPAYAAGGGGYTWSCWNSWMQALYNAPTKVFLCPSKLVDPTNTTGKTAYSFSDVACFGKTVKWVGSYGQNAHMGYMDGAGKLAPRNGAVQGGYDYWWKFTTIDGASQKMICVDSLGTQGICDTVVFMDAEDARRTTLRHPGSTANCLWADGHAEAIQYRLWAKHMYQKENF